VGVESKGRLKQRLLNQGCWPAFLKVRESLKAEGVEPVEAWRQAAEQFPPLDGRTVVLKGRRAAQAEALSQNIERPQPWAESKTTPAQERSQDAVLWVAAHLDNADLQPADAPSMAAWALLRWVQESAVHRDRFWEGIFAKLLPTPPEDLQLQPAGAEDGERSS
jgi:hypothetical protein